MKSTSRDRTTAFRLGLRFVRLAWRQERSLSFGLVVSAVLAGVLPAMAAWTGKRIVDVVVLAQAADSKSELVSESADQAAMWLAVEAGLMIALLLATRSQTAMRVLIGLKVGETLRDQLLRRVLRLPLDTLEDPETSDAIEFARRQAKTRPSAFVQHLTSAARSVLVATTSAALLITLSPFTLLIVLLSDVPAFIAQLRYKRAQHALENEQTLARRELGYLENLLTRPGVAKEERVMHFGGHLRTRFLALAEKIFIAEKKLVVRGELGTGGWSALGTLAVYGAYLGLVWSAAHGELTVGEMTMALIVVRQTQSASRSLLTDAAALGHDRLAIGAIFALIDLEETRVDVEETRDTQALAPQAKEREAKEYEDGSEGLRFEGVSYTYPGSTQPVIREVSFHVPRGKFMGLVGVNGCGKSTLLKLALGLVPPSSGRISFAGAPVGNLRKSDGNNGISAEKVGVAFQDFARYKLIVDDVIGLGDPESTRAQRKMAAEAAGADGFINKFSGGYEARLGRAFPGGTDLSGGEWQRLAIARAFLNEKARLWVFDEPSAALDPHAEVALFRRLRRKKEGRSLIVSAHRLAVLVDADEILVLSDGQILERGSHETLMELGGHYAELFELQGSPYRAYRATLEPSAE